MSEVDLARGLSPLEKARLETDTGCSMRFLSTWDLVPLALRLRETETREMPAMAATHRAFATTPEDFEAVRLIEQTYQRRLNTARPPMMARGDGSMARLGLASFEAVAVVDPSKEAS